MVDEQSLRLDTALLFDDVRSLATEEERNRLAREIHDGVAQEIASLGYLVDDLAATTIDPEARSAALALRREVTRVVSELRLSIFDLRHGIDEEGGLAGALAEYVREVGAASDLRVHLVLDEQQTALPPACKDGTAAHRPGGHIERAQALPGRQPVGDARDRWSTGTSADRGRRRRVTDPTRPSLRPGHHARAGRTYQRRVLCTRQTWRRHGRDRADPRNLLRKSKEPIMPTRVLLIDDHELIRQGLRRAFERSGDFEVVGEAGTVADGERLAHETAPQVVVTDVRLPDGTGLDLACSLRAIDDQVGIVVLTMYAGDETLLAAMNSGASAFVSKDAPSADVVSAARQAAVSPRSFAARDLAGAMQRRMQPTGPVLSARESEVLDVAGRRARRRSYRATALRLRVHRQDPHLQDLREARSSEPGSGHHERSSCWRPIRRIVGSSQISRS